MDAIFFLTEKAYAGICAHVDSIPLKFVLQWTLVGSSCWRRGGFYILSSCVTSLLKLIVLLLELYCSVMVLNACHRFLRK